MTNKQNGNAASYAAETHKTCRNVFSFVVVVVNFQFRPTWSQGVSAESTYVRAGKLLMGCCAMACARSDRALQRSIEPRRGAPMCMCEDHRLCTHTRTRFRCERLCAHSPHLGGDAAPCVSPAGALGSLSGR